MSQQLKLKRGKNADVPHLAEGEPAFATDTQELYIGTSSGNIKINAVTGVKGDAETDYRTGTINLTPANIGAAASSHTHEQADINGLSDALTGKADAVHTHAQSDITGLDTALSGKANTSHTHSQSEVSGLTAALSAKANTSHTHTQAQVTGLTDALDDKADLEHKHDIADVNGLNDKLTVAVYYVNGATQDYSGNTINLSSTAFVRGATTLTADSTTVTIPRASGDTNVYDDTSFLLYQNGLLLTPTTHFSVNSAGTEVTLTYTAHSGDIFDFVMQNDLSMMIADVVESEY